MAPKMSCASFRASKEKGQYSGGFHLGKKKGRASSALVQQGGMKAQNRFHGVDIGIVRSPIKRKNAAGAAYPLCKKCMACVY
ncbi:MAG: hypothetical protein DWQ15_09185 [Proteobacteria bacterium]|nr:MAG: hypothetical protein DWQ15_09185 [Pseudomonadota bacterium]